VLFFILNESPFENFSALFLEPIHLLAGEFLQGRAAFFGRYNSVDVD
jgi:hypothetical protein